jgi:hypothetical protein
MLSSPGMGGTRLLDPQDIAALRESCIQRLLLPVHRHHGQEEEAVYIIKVSAIASSLTVSGTRAMFHQLVHMSNNASGADPAGRILLMLVDDSPSYGTSTDTTPTTSLADFKTLL